MSNFTITKEKLERISFDEDDNTLTIKCGLLGDKCCMWIKNQSRIS